MSCRHCLHGSTISCASGGNFGNGTIDGGQGEAVRVPLAGSTLVKVPGSGHSDAVLRSLLTLSDAMSTGHHAAVSAGVKRGDTVAVVGDTAAAIARPGSTIGIVGVPHGAVSFTPTFFRNVGWRGGPAPARLYIPELLENVLDGSINPGLVLDNETDLDGAPKACAAIDDRTAIKSLMRVGSL
jgi:threonine dehydrogenase-like Zn-dependent dehydrogenase